MKLLKRDRAALESVRQQLKDGIGYIMEDDTAIMRKSSFNSTDVFRAPYYQDEAYNKCAKDIGSKWVYALNALAELEQLLKQD